MKEDIMRANGSIQHIDAIPADLKELYKTVWEMSMKDIIDMARHRGYFIDQSQSLNLFMQDPDFGKLNLNAFLRMEIWIKNRNVLPKNKIGSKRNAVYTSQKRKKQKTNQCLLKNIKQW